VLLVVVVNDSSSEELAPDELSSLEPEDSLLLLPSAVVVVVRGLAVVVRAAGTFSAGRKTLPMAMYPPGLLLLSEDEQERPVHVHFSITFLRGFSLTGCANWNQGFQRLSDEKLFWLSWEFFWLSWQFLKLSWEFLILFDLPALLSSSSSSCGTRSS
jgi:hypothetical protein